MPEALKILVVDDERDICDILYTFLSEGDHQVDCALDGQSALDAYERTPYDLVFLDIKLPDISGIDVLRRMRERRRNGKVVMVSGVLDDEVCDASLYGPFHADGFIPKPCHVRQIEEAIERVAVEGGRYVRTHRDEGRYLARKVIEALDGRGLDALTFEVASHGRLGNLLAECASDGGRLRGGLFLTSLARLPTVLELPEYAGDDHDASALLDELEDEASPLLDELASACNERFACELTMGLVLGRGRAWVFLSDDECRRSHAFDLPAPGDPGRDGTDEGRDEIVVAALSSFLHWLRS